MTTERREFGNLAGPCIIMLACIMIYLLTCFLLAVQENNKRRQEFLQHYTLRGERLTFGEGNRYETEFKK